jgi:acetolactate synthase-1/2/3 large subunit
VTQTEEFESAFAHALKSKRGALIELVLDPEVITPTKLLSKLAK